MGLPAPGQNIEIALLNRYVADTVIGLPTLPPVAEGNTVLLLRQLDTGLHATLSLKELNVAFNWSEGNPTPALTSRVARFATVMAQEFGDCEQFCPCTIAYRLVSRTA